MYYPQTRLYVANDGIERELRQITGKGSAPLRAVLRLRLHGDTARCHSAAEAKERLPHEYETALDVLEDTFVRYPIPLLQVVGTQLMPFLYEPDWSEGTSVASLRRQGRDRVRLLPGVIDRLVVLGPMLRPLIELHWVNDIADGPGSASRTLRSALTSSGPSALRSLPFWWEPFVTSRTAAASTAVIASTDAVRLITSSPGLVGRMTPSRTWSSPIVAMVRRVIIS